MAWPTHIEVDWNSFVSNVARYTVGSPSGVSYIWRGQSDSNWSLQPSLLRLLPTNVKPEETIKLEKRMKNIFLTEMHLHSEIQIDGTPKDYLKCLAVMQHHHAPTRLLDWTLSPFVAAYFAVESNWDEDGAIWFVHVSDFFSSMCETYKLNDKKSASDYISQFENPSAENCIIPVLNEHKSHRMVAQQGVFTVSTQINCNHETALDQACKDIHGTKSGDTYRKVIIPKDQKPKFLRMLKSMNISANSLFPGIDGLGKSLTELARLEAHYPFADITSA
jgi:hypothetical protein